MTEDDYDSIHAAVVETVRGRWFLAEYSRRSRVDEVQEMLSAIGRLEKIVTGTKSLPPPADASPHVRLLAQRADEIAARLLDIAEDLRESGADPYLCDDLDAQVRAISGLPRSHVTEQSALPSPLDSTARHVPVALDALPQQPLPEYPQQHPNAGDCLEATHEIIAYKKSAEGPEAVPAQPVDAGLPQMPRAMPLRPQESSPDPRLAALAALDRLTLTEKLSLFS